MSNAVRKKLLDDYAQLAPHYHTDKSPVWQGVRDTLKRLPKDARILDVGCGTGRISQVVPQTAAYVGVDFSPELIEVAKDLFPEQHFLVADAFQLPYEDALFSVVLSIAVVHHYPDKHDRIAQLEELYRVLEPGGRVVCTVWNLCQLKYLKLWRGWKKAYMSSQHDNSIQRLYYTYTPRELAREFRAVGFKNVVVEKKGNNIVAQAVK